MARPKKVKEVVLESAIEVAVPVMTPTSVESKVVIQPLSVDYPNEGLNDIARKINEIIASL